MLGDIGDGRDVVIDMCSRNPPQLAKFFDFVDPIPQILISHAAVPLRSVVNDSPGWSGVESRIQSAGFRIRSFSRLSARKVTVKTIPVPVLATF
ncbi:hypothetical protein [Actinophytocola sp.]|uniref:hypothetical protein n=1 Tax=Actinophytocola sp. TaxID=1872138 RepID=UPI003D6B5DA5